MGFINKRIDKLKENKYVGLSHRNWSLAFSNRSLQLDWTHWPQLLLTCAQNWIPFTRACISSYLRSTWGMFTQQNMNLIYFICSAPSKKCLWSAEWVIISRWRSTSPHAYAQFWPPLTFWPPMAFRPRLAYWPQLVYWPSVIFRSDSEARSGESGRDGWIVWGKSTVDRTRCTNWT